MKKPNITPGDWHIGMKPGPYVYGEKGEQVAACDTITNFAVENAANAKAISALPKLLDALECLIIETDITDHGETYVEITRDTLSKARSSLLAAGYTE